MEAGGRATQELKPGTMQEQLSRHEEHEGETLYSNKFFQNDNSYWSIRLPLPVFSLSSCLRGEYL